MNARTALWTLCSTLALAAIAASCATSSGSTYSHSESSETAAARSKRGSPSGPSAAPNPKPTRPAQPSPPDRPSPPSWPGQSSPPQTEDRGSSLFLIFAPRAEPSQPEGSLALEGLAQGSSVYVDDSGRSGATIRLPVGEHSLRVTRFGYRDFASTFSVSEEQTTSLLVEYVSESFSIRSVDVSPRLFDPADPGYLGSCGIEVLVASAGRGSAWVSDSRGTKVAELGPLAFAGPLARLRWNGRDGDGKAMPPGDYLVDVEGTGLEGGKDSAEARVSIQKGLFARSSSLYSGVSGALFAPDARALAAGQVEVASGAGLHVKPEGASMTGLGTAYGGARVGLPSSSNSELDLSYMSVLWQDAPDANSFSVTGAWKYSLGGAPLASPTAAALYVKASLARFYSEDSSDAIPPSWDGTTRFSGLSIGLPLEYASGRVRAFVSPEIELSNYYPNWADSGALWNAPGFFAWAYLRFGLEATTGPYTIAFSGALRSSPFGSLLSLAGPSPLGVEVRWQAPSSPLVLSLDIMGEVQDLGDYYFGAGLGLGYRY